MSLVDVYPTYETEPGTVAPITTPADLAASDEVGRLFRQYKEARRDCAALAFKPIPEPPAEEEKAAVESWLAVEALEDQRREARRQYRQIRITLGLLLLRQRDRSPKGKFKSWLRAQAIPVSSAYALLTRVMANPPGKPPVQVTRRRLQLKLNRWQHATATHALEKLQAAGQPFDLLATILEALLATHAPGALPTSPADPPPAPISTLTATPLPPFPPMADPISPPPPSARCNLGASLAERMPVAGR